MFGSLLKAAVGLVIETPIAIAADIITMGGACVDRDRPYTADALGKVMQNIERATEDDR